MWTPEESWLAPYAMRSADSRGRAHPEEPHAFRTPFQRDRERIVHCTGFRRLMGKTQVLVARINDHHRTRLTHTLEVTQIARTVARRLRLNEDLTEAIALSHDLGHPPFGHAGEQALDECLRGHGGFDHNLQGLRQVEVREDRYPDVPGLNLTWEVREAFVQHAKHRDDPELRPFLDAGGPLLEAQVVDTADSLAYDVHDIDDALGIDVITLDDLDEVEIWVRAAEPVRRRHPELQGNRLRTAVVRELIGWQVTDLLTETERRLADGNVRSADDVRSSPTPLVAFGGELTRLRTELEAFLFERVYQHALIRRMANKGQRVVKEMFAEFVNHPELLPERHLRRWAGCPEWLRAKPLGPKRDRPMASLERVVGDYIAGMTDRFAQQEHLRLFHPSADP
jgi:dGTPase